MSEALGDQHFQIIRKLLYDSSGISLADHKRKMVENRIVRRLQSLEDMSLDSYMNMLSVSDKDGEINHLINALTTNVTHFFREEHHFNHMSDSVSVQVRKRPQDDVLIWSAGCSIGAEPYSIAITMSEVMGRLKTSFRVKILATDIDTKALEVGRAGRFEKSKLKGLSAQRQKTYFNEQTFSEPLFEVKPRLRNMISFNRLNFNEPNWPMRKTFDFIFCRNVLIYFDREKQSSYINQIQRYLKPDGVLYLGHSEHAVMENVPGFQNKGQTIYERGAP